MKEKKVISILLAILLVFSVMPIVSLATDGTETTNEIEVANFDELKNNISIEGAILKLTEDITITEKLSINNTITIDGDGHNILGPNDNSNVYIEVLGGTVTIQNANLSQFGGNIGTVGQWGLIKVPAEANSSTKLVASNLNMKDFNIDTCSNCRNKCICIYIWIHSCKRKRRSDTKRLKSIYYSKPA